MSGNLDYEKEIVAIILYTSCFLMVVAVCLVVFFYFSRKKIIQKEIEKRELEIHLHKQQLHAIIVTQEEERKRIAQDLHDDISSKLNIVSLNTHLLSAPNLTEDETKEITDNIINLTAKALENSRKIAHNLLPPVFEKFGLNAGIEELCEEFESSKSVKVKYKSEIDFDEKEIDRHLHVFRILQELMNNSLNHGKASEIWINFKNQNGINICNYKDNGVGFDSKNAENQKGLGMKNIDSRISFLNGTLEIDSEIGKGIAVIFSF
ncbi:Oxygen sensor histidine kinase NreB [Flavobacterium bizetiae]|uniref:histidine kinase n=1 Tax=Flavobacterium bizetiae TaxID=2704140 RepID=A0A6J4GPH9_9FLAO|nr:histidine kinase [Flavobacterium bizetiae]CAA9199420.1 Oxygen sensor histidine kinase NreB [Flavobacterium bizetiae]CAD5342674.1 Oxygen sensor histidine kinase NreB [Flavobacterium bizetiae]CAD5348920.1 Oxygen sensor histidine kinase NreB [Flavobacterium bizetiae]